MNLKGLLFMLKGKPLNTIMKVMDINSGEVIQGELKNVRAWAKRYDKAFNQECNFIIDNNFMSNGINISEESANTIIDVMHKRAVDYILDNEDKKLIYEIYCQSTNERKKKIYDIFDCFLKELLED